MHVTAVFSGQVPKEPYTPNTNEDVVEFASGNRRVAVSDGASESFDSQSWARLLAARFVRNSRVSSRWLGQVVADFNTLFDPAALSWSKQASFDRGSFATLLGADLSFGRGEVRVVAVGDSLAVLLDTGELVESFPYIRAEEFEQRPVLLSTNPALNASFATPHFFRTHRITWPLKERAAPVLLLMTDALGHWALRRAEAGDPVWPLLVRIDAESDLEALVLRERQARTMRTDDTTLVRFSFGAQGRDELPLP